MSAAVARRSYRWMAIIVLVFLLATAGLFVYGLVAAANMPANTIGKVSDEIATRSGLSIYLVKGLAILISIPYFIAWSKLVGPTTKDIINNASGASFDPFYFFRDKWGWIIVGYVGGYYIVLAVASLGATAYKNCAETPDGLYSSDNTGIDPKYGIALTPCTADQRNELNHPQSPKELTAAQVKQRGFFSISGASRIWYTTDQNGSYHFFDRVGTDPEGDQLQPVTHQVAANWYKHQRQAVAQQQQASAQAGKQQALADDSAKAQQDYASGNYEQALASCKPVLAANPADEDCRQLQHDASSKLSRQLADRAQSELQQGNLEDASRDAKKASALDSQNASAKNVQTVAANLMASRR